MSVVDKDGAADRRAERREEILAAAERCVCRGGLAQLTLRAIAREWGKSLGGVYSYFESKEAIIEALVEREGRRFIETATARVEGIASEAPFGERLRAHLEQLVDAYLAEEGGRMLVFVTAEALVNPRVRQIMAAANQRLAEYFVANVIGPVVEENLEIHRMRVLLTRSFLESVRVLLLLNPTLDRAAVREVLLQRLCLICSHDIASDAGVPVEKLLASTEHLPRRR